MKPFVHLHTHSHYSLLNALPKVEELVKAAKKDGMEALALTDNGNLYGAIEFYKECKSAGIKPIIGVDFFVAVRTRADRQAGVDNRRYRLILLAKDVEGYRNLIKLVTESHLDGFYYKPRIDRELMQKYKEGLIAIIPSFSGETTAGLKMQDYERSETSAKFYVDTYGKENVFLELTRHPEIPGHKELSEQIVLLSNRTGIPLVAAQDVYYLKPEDRRARETLIKIQNQTDFSDRREETEEDFSFISQGTANDYFKDFPEALENTSRIASLCNVELVLGKWVFPNLVVESGLSYDEEFRRVVYEGLEKKGLEKTPETLERIEYELKVIKDKGYSPYFLVVQDLLNYAHRNQILTTIRGSVAGSLVTYLAGITNVNPLEYKLPFERFLNPERPSAPDIDMDYADNRRDEMIEYAKYKYGAEKVAQIGTFGTMMARGAVRDVARALGHPYAIGDRLAKLIPMGSQGFPMTIDRAMEESPELKEVYREEAEAKEIIDLAKKIEGCARHISVHAAGVVIAPTPLTDFVALQYDAKDEGKLITQYDMHAVEDAGLLKFDFLGIKNLAILADAVQRVKEELGIAVDIENIPIDDKKTFEMLARGETMGLFQLNGDGMTKYLKDLRPTNIHDINAMVALYRPGPMESIPNYIERKYNASLIRYIDPRLKDILSQSYGVITYQDDVLLISIHLAGYSWLEADKLRKAMGKKIPEVMQAEKEKLVKGFMEFGKLTPEKAEQLWKLIEPFAAYGFNKAHAASYGKVAYQTAYMKANFPAIYMAAVLTADAGDVEKIGEIIVECRRMKIPVLPPDINESFADFTVVKNPDGSESIRFGLRSIKNFGEGIAYAIINERKFGGRFASLADFLSRIKDKNLNKKSLEALVMCGAMDSFGERGSMLGNLEDLLAFNKEQVKTPDNQESLFGALPSTPLQLHLKEIPPASPGEKLTWEKELLGLYITGHPMDKYRAKLEQNGLNLKKIKEEAREGMPTVIAGIVEETRPIITKNGDRMAFIKIADLSDSFEAVAFPKVFAEFKDFFLPEKCIAIKGRISNRNGTLSVIAEKVKAL